MYFGHALTLWQKSLSIYETHRVTQGRNGKPCNSNHGSFDYKSSIHSHWLTNNVQMPCFTFKGLWTGLKLILIISFTFIELMPVRFGSLPGIICAISTLSAFLSFTHFTMEWHWIFLFVCFCCPLYVPLLVLFPLHFFLFFFFVNLGNNTHFKL